MHQSFFLGRPAKPLSGGYVYLFACLFLFLFCSHSTPYIRDAPRNTQVAFHSDFPDGLDYRLVLVGDAGKAQVGDGVMEAITAALSEAPARSAVIYLGDNIYDNGLPTPPAPGEVDEEYNQARSILDAQIGAFTNSKAQQAIFIPGNHDWDSLGERGYERIVAQGNHIAGRSSQTGKTIRFLPAGGCPDIATVDLGRRLKLVVFDSQRLIYMLAGANVVPAQAQTQCKIQNGRQFKAALGQTLTQAQTEGREVILAGHHPVWSVGTHGGFFDWSYHIWPRPAHWYLPLPIFASLVVAGRKAGWVTSTDMAHAHYHAMTLFLSEAIGSRRVFISAAGHDHNLQLGQTETANTSQASPRPPWADYYLVSGSGSKADVVSDDPSTLFAWAQRGFMILDAWADGTYWLRIAAPVPHPPEQAKHWGRGYQIINDFQLTPRAPLSQ